MIITGEQVRAAVAILKWSRRLLSDNSGINARTVQRIAESEGFPVSTANNVSKVAETLEIALKEKGWKFTREGGINPIASEPESTE